MFGLHSLARYPPKECLDTPHAHDVLKNIGYTVLYTVQCTLYTELYTVWHQCCICHCFHSHGDDGGCGGGGGGGCCGSCDGACGCVGVVVVAMVVTPFLRVAVVIVIGALE